MRTLLIHQFQVKPNPGEPSQVCFDRLTGFFTNWIESNYSPPKGKYRRVPHEPITWMGTGLELLGKDGHSLIHQSYQSKGAALVFIRWTHPHDDGSMDWRNHIQIAMNDGDLEVSLEIGLIQKKMVLAPPFFTLRNPRVFGEILSNFPCFIGNAPITGTAQLVTLQGVPVFVEKVLLNKARQLPVLVVTANRDDMYEIDPAAVAMQLRGLVTVIRLQDKWAAQHFTLRVGRMMGCFDGGVRLYWPGYTIDDHYLRHPLFLRARLHELGFERFCQSIFRKVAALTAFRHVEGAIIQAVKKNQELDRLTDISKLKGEVEQGNVDKATLEENLLKSWEANESLHKKNEELSIELSAVQRSFAEFSQAPASETAEADNTPETPPFASVDDVVKWVEEEFQSTLLFLDKAKRLAEESPYKDYTELYRLFTFLDSLVKRWQTDGAIGATWKDALREAHFNFKPDTSEMTRQKKWRGEYEAPYEGDTVRLDEHVTLGVGQNPQACLSVHWYRDEANKKLVIGRCGKHASNSLT